MIRGVALDLSKTNTGIATFIDGNLAHVDDISFKQYDYFGELLHNFKLWTDDWLKELDWVAYEEVRPINKYHMEQHFGMAGILARECYRKQIPLIGITTPAAKKTLTGKGNSNKAAMLEAAQERYPTMSIPNHDIADAIAVGLSAIGRMETN